MFTIDRIMSGTIGDFRQQGMTPCKGHFLVGFVFGERAVQAAAQGSLPDSGDIIIQERIELPIRGPGGRNHKEIT